jgi:hypothetical protein
LCNPSSKYDTILNSSDLKVEGLLPQETGLNNSWNDTCVGCTIWQPSLLQNVGAVH